MSSFETALRTLSHHAYGLVGGGELADELIAFLSKKHGIRAAGNADFFDGRYENFTIDDARALKSMHETRPVAAGSRKVFIIVVQGITVEAQNALLKLLEEPASYAIFFLIVPSRHLLLPTVRSRLSLIDGASGSGSGSDGLSETAKAFLSKGAAGRLEIVKKLLDDIAKEKKTKADAVDFLNEIRAGIYEKRGPADGLKALEAIELARRYAHDRSPSLKMLLEYTALNL